ncbi:MAG: hypothetical protein RJA70_518 [Pseudomonadota bacterium]
MNTPISRSLLASPRSLFLRFQFLSAFLMVCAFILPAAAQQAHTFVTLNSVQVTFDGTNENVTINFETDGVNSCFKLIAEEGKGNDNPVRSAFSICSDRVGQNTYTGAREDFGLFSVHDTLYLQSILQPIVQSGRLRPTGALSLHSVTDLGDQIQIVYSSSFGGCVSLIDSTDRFMFIFSNLLCDPGANQTGLINREDIEAIHPGDVVRMRVIGRNDLTTGAVTVGAHAPVAACVLATEELNVHYRGELNAPVIYSGGAVNLSPDAQVTGDVSGRGNAVLESNSVVDGDLTLVGTQSGTGDVTGELSLNAVVPVQTIGSVTFQGTGRNISVPRRQRRTLAPGSYGTVRVDHRGTLALDGAGLYHFKLLEFGEGAVLLVDTTGGSYDVRARDDLRIGAGFSTRGLRGTSPDASRITFSTGADDVAIGTGAHLLGDLVVPSGDVDLRDGSRVTGCVEAQKIKVGVRSVLSAD